MIDINWDTQPLGRVHDDDLAVNLGACLGRVRRERKARGIQAFPRRGYAPRGIDWDKEPRLGTMPDRKLAAELGCSRSSVYFARRGRGIAPFRRRGVAKPSAKRPVE